MSLPYGFMLAPDSHIIIDFEKANIVRTYDVQSNRNR